MTRSEARNQKRKEVVEAIILRKESVTLVARVHNLSLRNVFNWLARYRNGGWQALNDKSKQGRPRKVTGEDMQWLYNAITMGNPMNYQFSFCLWSLNIIRGLLEQERNIKLSKSSVSRLLNHLGLSPQKPLYRSYKQDPQKIKDYLSHTCQWPIILTHFRPLILTHPVSHIYMAMHWFSVSGDNFHLPA